MRIQVPSDTEIFDASGRRMSATALAVAPVPSEIADVYPTSMILTGWAYVKIGREWYAPENSGWLLAIPSVDSETGNTLPIAWVGWVSGESVASTRASDEAIRASIATKPIGKSQGAITTRSPAGDWEHPDDRHVGGWGLFAD